ncbi:dual specificity protein kinase TTK-like isoform X2 [Ptychodera flava]|uniref:dual specificity protein kinase TTK-like isoform X2 n=1 Tax=Ptychodera flava TaxID=63121 RepID=UPI003969D535
MSTSSLESLRMRLQSLDSRAQKEKQEKEKDDTSHSHTGTLTLDITDHTSWINKIVGSGNKPENWIEYLNYVEFRRHYQDKQSRYQYLYSVYTRAVQQMPLDENKRNLSYAKIHIRFALLQGEEDVEDGRMQFQYARANLRTIALVHVAAAQFELEHDNSAKSKSILRKAKQMEAEPQELLNQAMRRLLQGDKELYNLEEHGIRLAVKLSEYGQCRQRSWLASASSGSNSSDSSKSSEDIVAASSFSVNSSQSCTPSLNQHGGGSDTHMAVDTTVSFKTGNRSSASDGNTSSDKDTIPLQAPSTAQRNNASRRDHPYQVSLSASKSVKGSVFTPDTKMSLSSASVGPHRMPRSSQRFGGAVRFKKTNLPKVRENVGPEDDDDDNGDDDYRILHGVRPLDEVDGPEDKNDKCDSGSPSCRNTKTFPVDAGKGSGGTEKHLKENLGSFPSTVDLLRTKSFINRPSKGNLEDVSTSGDRNSSSSGISQCLDFNIAKGSGQRQASRGMSKPFPAAMDEIQSQPVTGRNKRDTAKSLFRQSALTMIKESPATGNVEKDENVTKTPSVSNTVVQTSGTPQMPRLFSRLQQPPPTKQEHSSVRGHTQQHAKHDGNDAMEVDMVDVDEVRAAPPQSMQVSHSETNQVSQAGVVGSSTCMQTPQPKLQYSQNMQMSTPSIPGNQQMIQQPQQFNQVGFTPQQPVMSQGCHATPMQSQVAITPGMMMPMQVPTQSNKPRIIVNGRSYDVLRKIGKGGSSKVYQVFDESKRKLFAIKQVNLDCADEITIQGYINEIDLLQKLQSSERIIHLYDHEVTDTHIYMVEECGSIDLASFLRKEKKQKAIKEEDIKHYWRQMLEAVECVHKQGIVHSDLKPANFLFVDAKLKLIDFGIANAIQQDKTSVIRESQVGTLNYMSPEAIQDTSPTPQFDAKGHRRPRLKIGCKSDVWSLGCILYYIVYGKTPFQQINSYAKLQAICDPNFEIEFPDINNKPLIDVLKKCLLRDPKERPSIQELLEHPYLQSPQSALSMVNVEQQFKNLLSQLTQNSPNSINVMSRSLMAQMQAGGNVDLSSVLKGNTGQQTRAMPPPPPPLNFSLPTASQPQQPLPSNQPLPGNKADPCQPQHHMMQSQPSQSRSSGSPRRPLRLVNLQEIQQAQEQLKPPAESGNSKYIRSSVDRENEQNNPGLWTL